MITVALGAARKNGITYFFFPQWEKYKFINHGFSSRSGGVSKGPFASLNLGYSGGDVPGAVNENRRRFLEIFGQKLVPCLWRAGARYRGPPGREKFLFCF